MKEPAEFRTHLDDLIELTSTPPEDKDKMWDAHMILLELREALEGDTKNGYIIWE